MEAVSLADAKARLSELVKRAQAGESISLTVRGKPVAKLVPDTPPRKPVDIEALERLAASLPPQDEDAGTFMRRMRDEYRY